MRVIFITLLLVSLAFAEFTNIKDLSQFFNGYSGTFVLYDKNQESFLIHNEQGANKALTPASTFKIYNALFGLDSGVVKDENSEFKWDGVKREYIIWNENHSLDTAIKYSVVWYFKRLASMVGKEKIDSYIRKIEYGNEDISGGVDKFWLNSTLKISALEQVKLLKRFYFYELPFSKRDTDIVKKILLISDKDELKFSGKTGSVKSLGWFVGYLEREAKVYFFALNIEGEGANGIKAKKIVREILKSLGLFEVKKEKKKFKKRDE